ncbi:MAG: hypothetical protein R2911_01380 [Caldilineaceae bacterium]
MPRKLGLKLPWRALLTWWGSIRCFLSDRYAAAVAEVLAANKIHVWLARDAPTPLISYAIVDKQAQGGVMITACHNPPRYSGLKLKAAYGGSASPADCKEVEQRILTMQALGQTPHQMELDEALAQGLVQRFNPLPAYQEHVRTLVDFDAIQRANVR